MGVGSYGELSGTFAIQRSQTAGASPLTILALTGGAVAIGAGGLDGAMTDVNGVLGPPGSGMAGIPRRRQRTATVPGFSVDTSVLLRVNTTGAGSTRS